MFKGLDLFDLVGKEFKERIQQKLIENKIIFLGGTKTQADVYLTSFLNEMGLKVLEAPDLRGEDFIVPLMDGRAITIVCRASPISFEAQRMMGHSLQFVIGWDDKKEEFVIKKDMCHIAVVGGQKWRKDWISILLSLYDVVFDGEEITEFINYVEKMNPIKPGRSIEFDYDTMLNKIASMVRGKLINLKEIQKIIKAIDI